MTEILVLEKPEEKLRRERERLLGELSVYGERLAVLQDTVDEIKEIIECYDEAIENLGTEHNQENSNSIYLLKGFLERGFNYLARDKDEKLWVYDAQPIKLSLIWTGIGDGRVEKISNDNFPEVKWSDKKPTGIADLLDIYQNGGENGK